MLVGGPIVTVADEEVRTELGWWRNPWFAWLPDSWTRPLTVVRLRPPALGSVGDGDNRYQRALGHSFPFVASSESKPPNDVGVGPCDRLRHPSRPPDEV